MASVALTLSSGSVPGVFKGRGDACHRPGKFYSVSNSGGYNDGSPKYF